MFAAGAYAAWSMFDHVQERVTIWLDPWSDAQGDGFQVVQSWFALAWGGIGGTGLGLGNPDRIPVVETDFIFAAIGEELGLLGTTAVIVAFLLLLGAGLRVAVRTDEPFEKLLAVGLTTLLALQAFIIMAGVTRLLPLTGVTLPFVSYGGSSLVGNYVLLALLVRVSDDTARRRGEVPRAATQGLQPRRWRREPARSCGSGSASSSATSPCSGWSTTSRSCGPTSSTTIPATPARSCATSTATEGRSSPPTAWCWPRPSPPRPGAASSTSGIYPQGELYAHVTGFLNFNFGADGVERSYNDQLAGETTDLQYQSFSDLFVDRERVGDVTLTIRRRRAAASPATRSLATGAPRGSVVALDPRTGAILAMYSNAELRPERPVEPRPGRRRRRPRRPRARLSRNSPLIPAMYRKSFFPGSTFKVVTVVGRRRPRRGHRRPARVPADVGVRHRLHRRRARELRRRPRAAARCS